MRGFPTLWRIATEYLFLRKLAPRSRALNAFYAGGFDHDSAREAEFLMGSCLLVRREAVDAVGGFDERFFLFSEETDWCYRFRRPAGRCGSSPAPRRCTWAARRDARGPMFREQVRGHLRFLAKHRGERQAERARRLLLVALALRGRALPRRARRGLPRARPAGSASGRDARRCCER